MSMDRIDGHVMLTAAFRIAISMTRLPTGATGKGGRR